METALNARLRNDAGVSAIAGSRVYWNARPEKSDLPALVLLLVNQERAQHFGGFMSSIRSLVQFTAMAEDQADAVALREAVIAAIAPEAEQDGIKFQAAQNIEIRGRIRNTNSALINQEIINAVIFHT